MTRRFPAGRIIIFLFVIIAALCYPIRMQDDVVGIIAVEVNRDTNWVWWTGFGSYLFYRLLANELAADFRLLGLNFHEND